MSADSFEAKLRILQRLLISIHDGKSFSIWGTGAFASDGAKIFHNKKINISYFIDNHPKDNGVFLGKPVFSADYLKDKSDKVFIFSTWWKDIVSQLKNNNYQGDIYIPDPWFDIFDEIILNDDDFNFFINFHHSLDYQSKLVLDSIISRRIGCDKDFFVSDYEQYFHPSFYYNDNDVVIDGGAYIGDTVEAFNRNVKVKEIHCFEPDFENYQKIHSINGINKVIPINLRLWSDDTELRFSSSKETVSYGCKISNEGDITIKVTSIDNYCIDNDVIPTVIKLDVEGAERDSLLGSKNIISLYKPKLAISIYHKYDDIWEIVKLIKKIRPDYNFYLGHHTESWMETILYGV